MNNSKLLISGSDRDARSLRFCRKASRWLWFPCKFILRFTAVTRRDSLCQRAVEIRDEATRAARDGRDGPVPVTPRPIINMNHELVRLAKTVSWEAIEARCGEVYSDGPGMPPLPTRLMAGLAILKHTSISRTRALRPLGGEPVFQFFCGETFFRHDLPFDRSSMTRWRQRMGEERIISLQQESLSVAVKTGAMRPEDTRRVIVDTTVQPRTSCSRPTPSCSTGPVSGWWRWRRSRCLDLRQSYVRVGKFALIRTRDTPCQAVQARQQGIAHAQDLSRPHHPRHRPPDRGRGRAAGHLPQAPPPRCPRSEQRQNLRGKKIYSLHAPRSNASAREKPMRLTSSA